MRTLDASRWQILRRVEAPDRAAAMPSAAPRSRSPSPPIGAVFGEWAGCADSGLGALIRQDNAQLETARLFAAVVVLSRDGARPLRPSRPSQSAASSLGDRTAGDEALLDSRRSPLAVALLALAARPRRLRREVRGHAPARREPLSLTLDFYPNPDHAGIYMAQKLGYFEEAGPRRLDPHPRRPGGADQAGRRRATRTWRSPTSRRCVLAHEQGLDVRRHRGARQPAADLDDLAEEIRDQGRRRPERQDDRHRRHPLPGRLPEDDPRPRQADPRRRQGRSTSASACCRPWSAASAQAMLGGYSNVEGVDLRRARQAPGGHPGRPARRPDLRRARPRRQPREARRRPGKVPPLHRRPGTRHRRRRGTARRRRPKRCSKPTPTSTRN